MVPFDARPKTELQGEADSMMGTEFLPNLFLLGAAKCGTTTLYRYLGDLPDVCMSDPKEPFFFEAEFADGVEFYRKKYFRHWQGEPVIGEARHRNLYLPFVPERVHAVNPNAKLIVLVRNPIDRAFSHWNHYLGRQETLSFAEAIRKDRDRIEQGLQYDTVAEIESHKHSIGRDAWGNDGYGLYRTYLDSGYYMQQIQRYLKLFPRGNLKVVLFEDLAENPAKVISDIVSFLELDPARNRFVEERWENPWNGPTWSQTILFRSRRLRKLTPWDLVKRFRRFLSRRRSAKMLDRQTRDWLREHYREHNSALASFLGTDLSHWNK